MCTDKRKRRLAAAWHGKCRCTALLALLHLLFCRLIRGSRNAMPEDFEAVIAHLENVAFPVDEVISKTVSLEDAPAAMATWSENPGEITKIHVTLD